MRRFLVFAYPEEVGPPLWPTGVVRDGKDEKIFPAEAVGRIFVGGREDKKEILDKNSGRALKSTSRSLEATLQQSRLPSTEDAR
jgi:hypothetical protein